MNKVVLSCSIVFVGCIAVYFLRENLHDSSVENSSNAKSSLNGGTTSAEVKNPRAILQADTVTRTLFKAPAEVVTAAALDSTLVHIANGHRLKDTPDYRNFVAASALDPAPALALIQNKFDATPDYQVQARSMLFGLIIEIANAIKQSNDLSALDRFVQEAKIQIDLQMKTGARVEVPVQSLTQAEVRELVHVGPYVTEGGKLFVNTFQPKFMALAVFMEAGTDNSRTYLTEIANDPSIDPKVREIAEFNARQRPLLN